MLAVVMVLAALVQDAGAPLYALAALNGAAGILFLMRAFRDPPAPAPGDRPGV